MASQQSQSEPELWNELPPEILGLILSYLGKHDLLNARLISQAWNEESLKLLRKSNFTQMLTEKTLKEYLLFITSTERERRLFIIPFHLNFKSYCKQLSLSSGAVGLITASSRVENLCQIFGPQCVSKLTLTLTKTNVSTKVYGHERRLIEFLTLISPGLKSLDFTRFDYGNDFLENQIITFPKLKQIICNTNTLLDSGGRLSYHAYISIIENCPNLEDLTLTLGPQDLEPWPLKFNQLKSLSIGIMINPQNILDKILASSEPPVLRELSFGNYFTRSDEDNIAVYNILKSVSSTLRSLKVRNLFSPQGTGVTRFPKLSHLEHLGLESYIGARCWRDIEDMNLNAETFPSLKSIELPTTFFYTTSPPCQSEQNIDVRIEFPNLIRLILRVTGTFERGVFKIAMKRLQQIFPTPTKLSLVDGGGGDCVKYTLGRIMKSNWPKNIQEIQMIGFYQDYLGQFLDELKLNPRVVLETCDGILENLMRIEFQNMMKRMKMEWKETVVSPGSIVLARANQLDLESIKMTNITTIKLDLIGESPFNLRTSHLSTRASIPNLTAMAKHFPQLRNIEVSGLLCHPRDKSVWSNHILEFNSKFPCVNLYLT